MTLIELSEILENLSWEDGVEKDENYLSSLMTQCDDQDRALLIILKWFNANRPDEGFVTVI